MSAYPRVTWTKRSRSITTRFYNGQTVWVGEVPRDHFTYADTATVRRKRPLIPFLQPTPLKRFYYELFMGDLSFMSRRSGSDFATIQNAALSFDSGNRTGWLKVPGLSVAGNGVPSITRSIDMEYLLNNKILSKIKDLNLSFPVAILEGRKTASWMAQRVTSLAHAFGGVKRGKWERVRDAINAKGGEPPKAVTVTLGRYGYKPLKKSFYRNPNRLPEQPPKGWSSKSASERWLEVQYAFKPLMSDVEGAATALAKYLEDNQLLLCTRRAVVWDVKEGPRANLSYAFRADYPRLRASYGSKSVIKYKAQITYTFDKYLAAFVQNGLTNLPSTAWEVVPYSFVSDWFITVGDYLELLDATIGCKFIAGTRSRLLRCGSFGLTVEAGTGNTGVVGPGPSLFAECYQRETLGSFPTPQVVVKSPLSTSHVITALALVRSMRR